MTTHYDPDADCHYSPGCCSVGGTRTKPSLLAEFRRNYPLAGGAAKYELWAALASRHPQHCINKWFRCITAIVEATVKELRS